MARQDDGLGEFEESDVVVIGRAVVLVIQDDRLHYDGFLSRFRLRDVVFSKHDRKICRLPQVAVGGTGCRIQ